MRSFATLILVLWAGIAHGFERTEDYEQHSIGGWTVLISSSYDAYPEKKQRAVAELTRQLSHINSHVPQSARARIMQTKIWLEHAAQHAAAGRFHVSVNWLRENGYNPDKAWGVEMNYNMVLWRRFQPMILLHELSHAYHHLVLGLDYRPIRGAFEQAMLSGKYDNVLRNDGARRRAYAMTNYEEYFAELTEAYFGENDDQPFRRSELAEFDPTGFSVVRDAWTKFE